MEGKTEIKEGNIYYKIVEEINNLRWTHNWQKVKLIRAQGGCLGIGSR